MKKNKKILYTLFTAIITFCAVSFIKPTFKTTKADNNFIQNNLNQEITITIPNTTHTTNNYIIPDIANYFFTDEEILNAGLYGISYIVNLNSIYTVNDQTKEYIKLVVIVGRKYESTNKTYFRLIVSNSALPTLNPYPPIVQIGIDEDKLSNKLLLTNNTNFDTNNSANLVTIFNNFFTEYSQITTNTYVEILLNKIELLETENTNQQLQINNQLTELNNLRQQITDQTDTINTLNDQISSTNNQLTTLNNQITTLQNTNSTLSTQLQNVENQNENLINQIDILTNALDSGGNAPIDIPNLVYTILTLPFTFIEQAFDLTLWPGTAYQVNFSNIIKGMIAILTLLLIIRLFTNGFSVFEKVSNGSVNKENIKSQTRLNNAKADKIEKSKK